MTDNYIICLKLIFNLCKHMLSVYSIYNKLFSTFKKFTLGPVLCLAQSQCAAGTGVIVLTPIVDVIFATSVR